MSFKVTATDPQGWQVSYVYKHYSDAHNQRISLKNAGCTNVQLTEYPEGVSEVPTGEPSQSADTRLKRVGELLILIDALEDYLKICVGVEATAIAKRLKEDARYELNGILY